MTGVSGSGKSSLINDIVAKELQARLHRANTVPGRHDEIQGIKELDKAIVIDPIADWLNTPDPNPAITRDYLRRFVSYSPAHAKKLNCGGIAPVV